LRREGLGERHRYALEPAPLCACCRVPGRERCRSAVRSAPGRRSTSAVASGSTERILSSRGLEKRISNAVAVVRSSRRELATCVSGGRGWTRASIPLRWPAAPRPRQASSLHRALAWSRAPSRQTSVTLGPARGPAHAAGWR
jgi:hypothetical protein